MASNRFGNLFTITTWGESHGKALGVVIDGCPAGLPLEDSDINVALALRAPGKSAVTSPRKEADRGEILSGVFEGMTTGTPICILIANMDADSSKYTSIKDLLRPGHANYTYLKKYGIFDYRGGGRSSGRETVCRVAAGAVAKKLLSFERIEIAAYLSQVNKIKSNFSENTSIQTLRELTVKSPLFCPDPEATAKIFALIERAKEAGDSLGGVVSFTAHGMPPGLGDPIYEKLEANLAKAMMSLPATKGFEIGSGFEAADMQGSEHNDFFFYENNEVKTATNYAGGVLGGISTGMPLTGSVAFKPTSSIKRAQQTVSVSGEPAEFKLPEGSRHDPCVAIRAVPIVEAMLALVLADALLLHRCSRVQLT